MSKNIVGLDENGFDMIREFAFEAPIEDVIEGIFIVVKFLGVEKAWHEFLLRIRETKEYNLRLSHLKRQLGKWNNYRKKLSTYGRNLTIYQQYLLEKKEHEKDSSYTYTDFREYINRNPCSEFQEKYKKFYPGDTAIFISDDLLAKTLSHSYLEKWKPQEPMSNNPFFDFRVTVSEQEALQEFGENNIRHFYWMLFLYRNLPSLSVLISLTASSFCGTKNKQSRGKNKTSPKNPPREPQLFSSTLYDTRTVIKQREEYEQQINEVKLQCLSLNQLILDITNSITILKK